jgi:hypothetical protein
MWRRNAPEQEQSGAEVLFGSREATKRNLLKISVPEETQRKWKR